MPTRHRRIAIIRDEEVDHALSAVREASATAGEDPVESDAGLARQLLLSGAQVVAGELRTEEDFRRWIIAQGGTPARRSMSDVMDELRQRLPAIDPDDPYRAQRILQELREDRI